MYEQGSAAVQRGNNTYSGEAMKIAPPPDSPIVGAMRDVDMRLNELRGILNQLEQRLQPVLGLAGPECSKDAREATSNGSLVDGIHQQSERVSASVRQVASMLERLHL